MAIRLDMFSWRGRGRKRVFSRFLILPLISHILDTTCSTDKRGISIIIESMRMRKLLGAPLPVCVAYVQKREKMIFEIQNEGSDDFD